MTEEPAPPAEAQRRRGRIEVTLIAAFALGVTILLSAIRVPRIQVVLRLVVDEVGLQFREEWEIYDFPLRELSASNAKSLTVLGGLAGTRGDDPGPGPGGDLEILGRSSASVWQAWLSSDYLRLNLTVPPGADLRLSMGRRDGGTLQMTLGGAETVATLDTGSELELRCASCVAEPGPIDPRATSGDAGWPVRPARRMVQVDGAEVPLLLTMRVDSADEAFTELVEGSRMTTRKVDFLRAGAGPEASAVSGPGSIVFPTLETDPIPIESGEFVLVSAHDVLTVRRISMGDALEVELRGTVDELSVGPGGALRSQRPTLLQYLSWNKWLQIVVGAALTLGAAVSTALYRLGLVSGPKE